MATLYAKQEAYSCHYKRGWVGVWGTDKALSPAPAVVILRRLCATALITHCTPKVPRFLTELLSALQSQLEASPGSVWGWGFSCLQDELMVEGTRANLTGWDPQKDLILRVCVSNAVGYGPWSQPLVVSAHDHAGKAWGGGVERSGVKAFKDNGLMRGGRRHLSFQCNLPS